MWWTWHAFFSGIIAVFYFLFTLDILSTILLFTVGVLIDTDHYIVFKIVKKGSFSNFYKKFYNIAVKNEDGNDIVKYIVPFHNFEFIIFLFILSFYIPFFTSIAIGASSHFVMDVIWIRRFKIKSFYSVTYYIFHRYVRK